MPATVLDVQGMTVEIGLPAGILHAVTDVDFSVRAGETFAIVGESGSGKTITALAVMGLLPRRAHLTRGSIRVAGIDISGMDKNAIAAIRGDSMSMIFQDPMTCLNPVYTIGSQLEEGYIRHGKGSRRAARERAEYLLEQIGIVSPKTRMAQYPHQLSGGLRQRMMIAMALMCEPTLLIADEPTTALDVTVQVQILRLLADLQKSMNLALILITHDLGIVARMADRVAVMYGGRIVETATCESLFARPAHPYTRGLLDCIPSRRRGVRLGTIPGIVPSLIGEHSGCAFRNRCSEATDICVHGIIAEYAVAEEHLCRCVHAEPQAPLRIASRAI